MGCLWYPMGHPWVTPWGAGDTPWDTYGSPVGYPTGHPWISHGVFVVPHGASVGDPWVPHGAAMGDPWGNPMGHLWVTHEMHTKCAKMNPYKSQILSNVVNSQ